MDSRARSLAKAISWRVVGATVTVGIGWGVTGDVAIAASMGVLDVLGKTALFYVHERAWARVPRRHDATPVLPPQQAG